MRFVSSRILSIEYCICICERVAAGEEVSLRAHSTHTLHGAPYAYVARCAILQNASPVRAARTGAHTHIHTHTHTYTHTHTHTHTPGRTGQRICMIECFGGFACGCKSGCIHMVGSALTWHQNKTTPPNLHFRGRQCTDFVVTAYTSRVGMTTPWASRLACASSSKARSDLAAVTAAKKSLAVSVYHFANTRVRQNVAGPCVLVWMRSQSS
jgi:hypothetical protein